MKSPPASFCAPTRLLNDGPTHTHFGDRTCDGLRAIGRLRAAAAQLARGIRGAAGTPRAARRQPLRRVRAGHARARLHRKAQPHDRMAVRGGEVDRLPELAAEVVQRKVDVIVAGETPVISAAQKATATIPIVMAASNDPVGSGFVESLGRPGHNITGVSILSTDLSGKLVEMLQNVAPTATRVAILLNPRNSSNAAIAINLQVAMQGARVTGQPVAAATAEGIEQAFARMQRQDASAVVVAADSFFVEQRERIAQLALKHRLPSIFS